MGWKPGLICSAYANPVIIPDIEPSTCVHLSHKASKAPKSSVAPLIAGEQSEEFFNPFYPSTACTGLALGVETELRFDLISLYV